MILKPILLLIALALSGFFGYQVYEGDLPRLLAFFLWAVTFFMGFIVAMRIEREVKQEYGSMQAAPLLIKAIGGLALGYDVGSNITLGTTMFFVVDLLDTIITRRRHLAGMMWWPRHPLAFTYRLKMYKDYWNDRIGRSAVLWAELPWRYHVAVFICGQLNRHDSGHC